MDLKPRSDWKLNCSITRGRGAGGQIRWKGAGAASGSDRFLVIVERNKGKPNAYRRSELVEGRPSDAAARMAELIEEAEAVIGAPTPSPAPESRTSAPSPSLVSPEDAPAPQSVEVGAVSDGRPVIRPRRPTVASSSGISLGLLAIGAVAAAGIAIIASRR